MTNAQKSTRIAEIMDTIEADGGPRAWMFDTQGNVTLQPSGLADLIHWAAKHPARAATRVGEIMAVVDAE